MTVPTAAELRAATHDANDRVQRLTGWFDRLVPFRGVRPLDRIPSLKLKLSIVILAAVAVTVGASTVAFWLDVRPAYGVAVAVVLALAMVQILARGLTAPLREMVAATDRMAGGHYEQRVEATGTDEVGQLVRSFNAMAAELALLEDQRRQLIANVSHELRTPIAVLQGSLENLIDGVAPAADDTLAAMHRQTVRLGRLVQQLLDLSRLESGEVAIDHAPTDLVAVIAHVAAEAELRQPPPILAIDTPPELIVAGDAARLHQVVANLVDNAIEHGGTTTPIEIRAERDGTTARLRVADRGPGIPDEHIGRVFDRYVGSSTPTSTGLGLAIAKSIIDRHGGSIAATNTEPGCRFDVALPLA